MIMGSLDLSSSYLKVQTESRPNVTIEKQDAETGLLITASPAVYKVLDSGGRTLIENLRTGSDGKAVIKEELRTAHLYRIRYRYRCSAKRCPAERHFKSHEAGRTIRPAGRKDGTGIHTPGRSGL